MSVPLDRSLYERVKQEVKRRVSVWPSAYASGQLVREYKKRGGRYASSSSRGRTKSSSYSSSKSRSKSRGRRTGNLSRWYKEDWRNVCERDSRGHYKKCGSPSSRGRSLKKYPYCRPLHRVSKETPRTQTPLVCL